MYRSTLFSDKSISLDSGDTGGGRKVHPEYAQGGTHSFSASFLPSGRGSSSCPVLALISLVAILFLHSSTCQETTAQHFPGGEILVQSVLLQLSRGWHP